MLPTSRPTNPEMDNGIIAVLEKLDLLSQEWLIAARRRLGLAIRTMKTRGSNCRFHEIGLTGDYAPRCAGKVGLKMRHDALTLLVARAFQKALT